jgi:Holliday junction DNA helicase RuvA
MYAYIKGRIAFRQLDALIVEAGGIGYRIQSAPGLIDRFGRDGEEATVHTHLYVREDIMALYGFPTREELSMFEMLLTVSGIGPKVASNILAVASPSRVAMAIVTGDAKTLTQASGLGKKGAERLILELKDKLKGVSATSNGTAGAGEIPPSTGGPDGVRKSEAMAALVVLGYTANDAARVVSAVHRPDMETEGIIRAALRERVK